MELPTIPHLILASVNCVNILCRNTLLVQLVDCHAVLNKTVDDVSLFELRNS